MPDNELVCSLTAADYRDREAAWRKVGESVTASTPIVGGLSVSFAPARGLTASLTELVRLEAECCAWMAFAMSDSPEGIGLSITSNAADGEHALREAIALLVRTSGPGSRLTT